MASEPVGTELVGTEPAEQVRAVEEDGPSAEGRPVVPGAPVAATVAAFADLPVYEFGGATVFEPAGLERQRPESWLDVPWADEPRPGETPPASLPLVASVDEAVLSTRLKAASGAETLRRRLTAAFAVWSMVVAGWLAWCVLRDGGSAALPDSLAGWEVPAVVWAVLFVLRAWAADRHDARLRDAAKSWVRVARVSGAAKALPDPFRDPFVRSDRVLNIVAVVLVVLGIQVALPDVAALAVGGVRGEPLSPTTPLVLGITLVCGAACLVSVSGRQGRRRALELLDLRRWWM